MLGEECSERYAINLQQKYEIVEHWNIGAQVQDVQESEGYFNEKVQDCRISCITEGLLMANLDMYDKHKCEQSVLLVQ